MAIAVTVAGVAAHLAGVITRGLAVHRIPWGNMYEFVTALTCVAVIFFLGLMIRYRAYRLGLFVMGAVVLALGLAQTVLYTAAGPLVPALQSYWLSIHVTAMTVATGTYLRGRRARGGLPVRPAARDPGAGGRPAGADGIMRGCPGPRCWTGSPTGP